MGGSRSSVLQAVWVQLIVTLALVVIGAWQTGVSPAPGHNILVIQSHPTPPRTPPVRPYQFPSGGRVLLPAYRFIALYGTPDDPSLGVLGQQPLGATLDRAKALAATYQPLMGEHALPTLEIIATVASAYPEPDGSYSRTIDSAKLMSWVQAAQQAGIYVVLDLQPGRSSFLSQAQQHEQLLTQPNVGLALDPEWRLAPDQVPLDQIGSVGIDEVNQTVQWLAELTRQHKLPQKLFLLHQFRLSMLPDRTRLDTTHPELAYIIQMDGQGTQPQKQDSWNAITAAPTPTNYFGWKNFYTQDASLRSPEETMQLVPAPWYISYQ